MFEFCANKSRLTVKRREPVVSGSVNVYQARFFFSTDWDGLTRTAVFRGDGEAVSVLLDETNTCTVPWEVLVRPKVRLMVGVYGTRGGDVILPTMWAQCGFILLGTAPGTNAQPPTPDLWQQELSGLREALNRIPQPMTAGELREILTNGGKQNG